MNNQNIKSKAIHYIKQIDIKIHKVIDNKHNEIENGELTPMENWVLGYLVQNKSHEVYQKDIEQIMGLARSTVAERLCHMESLGYIKRIPSNKDLRQKQIILVDKGINVTSIIGKTFEGLNNQMISGFSEEELNTLYSYLERINKNLEKGEK